MCRAALADLGRQQAALSGGLGFDLGAGIEQHLDRELAWPRAAAPFGHRARRAFVQGLAHKGLEAGHILCRDVEQCRLVQPRQGQGVDRERQQQGSAGCEAKKGFLHGKHSVT
ncbi:hypothetical protein D3C71_1811060 [compost metagenome]